jgi:hypothetical protein
MISLESKNKYFPALISIAMIVVHNVIEKNSLSLSALSMRGEIFIGPKPTNISNRQFHS